MMRNSYVVEIVVVLGVIAVLCLAAGSAVYVAQAGEELTGGQVIVALATVIVAVVAGLFLL